MARNEERIPTGDKKNETVTMLSTGDGPPDITPPKVTNDNTVKGSAIDENFVAPAEAEPPIYGLVVETKLVHCNRAGGRVTMRAGKVVSSKDFDLAHLARQGLKMKKHEPEKAMPLDQMFVD